MLIKEGFPTSKFLYINSSCTIYADCLCQENLSLATGIAKTQTFAANQSYWRLIASLYYLRNAICILLWKSYLQWKFIKSYSLRKESRTEITSNHMVSWWHQIIILTHCRRAMQHMRRRSKWPRRRPPQHMCQPFCFYQTV